MINNEIGRDERVHLSENDVIENQKCAADMAAETESAVSNEGWEQSAKGGADNVLINDMSEQGKRETVCKRIQGAIFPVLVLGIILALIIMLFIINNTPGDPQPDTPVIPYHCDSMCRTSLVESIPENLTYPSGSPSHNTTYSAYKQLISQATTSLFISSMYWTLRAQETPVEGATFPSADKGEDIFKELKKALKRNVNVTIALSTFSADRTEIDELERQGANVRVVQIDRLFGAGILHTKFIISDMNSFYLGSANMDWRSLTQVKEMGVFVQDCDCPLLADLYHIFEIYWKLGEHNSTVPDEWPVEWDTHYNLTHPLQLEISVNETAYVSLSSSPAKLATPSRDVDLDAIQTVMGDADKYIDIAVMDYAPATLYLNPNKVVTLLDSLSKSDEPNNARYWPDLETHMKEAAFNRDIKVRLLASIGANSNLVMLNYLRSLQQFHPNIQVKAFVVPADGDFSKIPFARVNHNKYMVTDRVAYIGTSNWSGDYFLDTGGVGMIFNQTESRDLADTLRDQLQKVFLRDWNSGYSFNVTYNFEIKDGQVIVTPP